MGEEYGFWRKTDYGVGLVQEYSELIIYSAVAFLIPFLLAHPQLVVGIVVNAALVLAALNTKDYKLLPVVMLPSIAVLARGLIFGPFTMFLIYLIPFIWIGNAILVYAFKELKLKRKMNSIVTLLIGATAKMVFLFLAALLLVKTGVIPAPFLLTMGVFQLSTALAGGVIALGIHEAKKKLSASN